MSRAVCRILIVLAILAAALPAVAQQQPDPAVPAGAAVRLAGQPPGRCSGSMRSIPFM